MPGGLPDHPRKWWLHERLRNLLHVTVNEEVEVVRKGLKLCLNPADYTDEIAKILHDSGYKLFVA